MLDALRRFPFFVLVVMAFAVAMLFPALIAWQYDLHTVKQAFLRSSVFLFIVSSMIGVLMMDRRLRGDYRDHLASLVAMFLLLPFILALPIIQAVGHMSFAEASFEMLSSLTTTGATLLEHPFGTNLPLMVYTSLVAWLGAFVMLLVAFVILEPTQIGGFELVSETTGIRARQTGGGLGQSDRFVHYFGLLAPPFFIATIALAFLLTMSGERFLYAVIHAWSIMSTSGISPYGDLSQSNMGVIGEAVMVVFLLFGLSRNYLLQLGQGRLYKGFLEDPEIRVSLVLMALAQGLFIIAYIYTDFDEHKIPSIIDGLKSVWGTFFTVISFISTHGETSEYWQHGVHGISPATPALFVMGLAMLGGGVATTAGGIKLLRIYALFKLSQREVTRIIDPHSIATSGRAGRALRQKGGINAFVFLMLFIAGVSTAALAFAATGIEFEQSIVAALAAATNCGPLLEILPLHKIDITEQSGVFYAISAITMIFGRVEVFVLIALINPDFWRERRR